MHCKVGDLAIVVNDHESPETMEHSCASMQRLSLANGPSRRIGCVSLYPVFGLRDAQCFLAEEFWHTATANLGRFAMETVTIKR